MASDRREETRPGAKPSKPGKARTGASEVLEFPRPPGESGEAHVPKLRLRLSEPWSGFVSPWAHVALGAAEPSLYFAGGLADVETMSHHEVKLCTKGTHARRLSWRHEETHHRLSPQLHRLIPHDFTQSPIPAVHQTLVHIGICST